MGGGPPVNLGPLDLILISNFAWQRPAFDPRRSIAVGIRGVGRFVAVGDTGGVPDVSWSTVAVIIATFSKRFPMVLN